MALVCYLSMHLPLGIAVSKSEISYAKISSCDYFSLADGETIVLHQLSLVSAACLVPGWLDG